VEQVTKAPAHPARLMGQSVDFLRSVKAELKKVTWPTRDELSKATRMILILAVVLGLAIGWMDLLFNWILVSGVARLGR
jgi:preprotein translocase subunit SecE